MKLPPSIWLKHLKNRFLVFLTVLGPGIIVMLADTDVGSLVVVAQSGAVYGYKLLSIQLLLIPILYITQELTVRLGICAKKGHGELIREHFGSFWAHVSVSTLVICCIGAILTEMSGIASVGLLFGVPIWASMLMTVVFLAWLVYSNSYYSVEKIALAIGAFELIYLLVAWQSHPSVDEIRYALSSMPLHDKNFLYLIAANIGAVIMPWMIFYQQSAIVDKKLKVSRLKAARIETFIGAIATQAIMIAVLVATAATIGKTNPAVSLQNVQQISDAFVPYMGMTFGKILFSLGMLGAALIATIVVSLTAAWGVGELTGFKRSLHDHPKDAPWFYGIYLFIILLGAVVIMSHVQLVHLNIAIEVLNSLLLPIVLLFLFLLARRALPEEYRLKGWYAVVTAIILSLTGIVGFGSGIIGMFK